MSLARTLLNGDCVTESVDLTGFEYDGATTESSFLDIACEALVADIYNVDKAFHVADIMGEVKVIKEGADAEAILEGMISDAIDKIKAGFKKFLAKIKDFFAKVKKLFQSFTLQGKKFVKQFKTEIEDKKADGFKYHAFKYTLSAGDGDAKSIFDAVNREIDVCAANIKKAGDEARDLKELEAKLGKSKMGTKGIEDLKTGSEYTEEILKKIGYKGATEVTELTSKLKEAYRNGEETAEDFEEFESNSKSEMLELVENSDKKISDFEKAEKAFEKDVNALIKALDSIKETKDADGNVTNEKAYKLAHKRSSQASQLLALGKIPCDVQIAAYKEAAASFRSILGSFVRFKPAKEAMEEEIDEEGCGGKKRCGEACNESSLLESAMNLI